MTSKRSECGGPTHELCTEARRGRLASVTSAISAGADVSAACECQGMTALSIAAMRNRVDIATVLIQNGANINSAHGCKQYPLHVACRTGSTAMVRFLLAQGADPNQMDKFGGVALHYCSDVRVARLLLDAGATVEVDNDWMSPLHTAVSADNVGVARILIKAGADLERKVGGHGDTPLALARGEARLYLQSVMSERGLCRNTALSKSFNSDPVRRL
jgi:ankyrin repeat protein